MDGIGLNGYSLRLIGSQHHDPPGAGVPKTGFERCAALVLGNGANSRDAGSNEERGVSKNIEDHLACRRLDLDVDVFVTAERQVGHIGLDRKSVGNGGDIL